MVVDNDARVGDLIRSSAEAHGFEALVVPRSDEFMACYAAFTPHLIVLDLMMPEVDGIQLLHRLAEEGCQAEIVLFSGADSRVLNAAARPGGLNGLKITKVLSKPQGLEDLGDCLASFAVANAPVTEESLRLAILAGEIEPFYQPKACFDEDGGWAIVGLEALARWPRRGSLVEPSAFIPMAERCGLIDDVTDLMLHKAARELALLHDCGIDLELAINIPVQTLMDPAIPDRFDALVAGHGLQGSQLIVEITESAAMADAAATLENVARFRLKGIQVAMDDFGTGFSSLIQLFRIPFSELKIDQSFVREVATNREAEVIVRSTIDLAHNLHMGVCAEGVESEAIFDSLRQAGCDQIQGYYISRPLPATSLHHFLLHGCGLERAAELEPAWAS